MCLTISLRTQKTSHWVVDVVVVRVLYVQQFPLQRRKAPPWVVDEVVVQAADAACSINMVSNKDALREDRLWRRKRNRLRREMETPEERDARLLNWAIDQHVLYWNFVTGRREYDRRRCVAMTPDQHQQQRKVCHPSSEQNGSVERKRIVLAQLVMTHFQTIYNHT